MECPDTKLIPTSSAYSSPQSPKSALVSRLPYPPSKRTLSNSLFGSTQYIYYSYQFIFILISSICYINSVYIYIERA
ncbi:hypothetical protein B9Z55_028532 [Caenorhabditis nigoni]|nr:hypothetical protein B9Z55_028532 [Caenorhabditis nigoni]